MITHQESAHYAQQNNPEKEHLQSQFKFEISIRNQISEARNLLPSSILRSQPAKHLIQNFSTDFQSESQGKCYLDFNIEPLEEQSKNFSKQMFKKYGNNLNNLLKNKSSIVFLSSMALQHFRKLEEKESKKSKRSQNDDQSQQEEDRFGVVSVLTKDKQNFQQKYTNINNDPQFQFLKINRKRSALQFFQNFESSNLHLASEQSQRTYILATRLDYNTNSYGQWFYFKVKNITQKDQNFQFVLVNMTKTYSMFGQGLKISVCRDNLWQKDGQQISYQRNFFKRNPYSISEGSITNSLAMKSEYFFSLSFKIRIRAGEQLYLAYNQPYSYSRLNRKVDRILLQNFYNKELGIKRSIISRTVLDNRIDMLTVTLPTFSTQVNEDRETESLSNSPKKQYQAPFLSKRQCSQGKKVIVITARTHPVETAGSFVMQGIMQELCKSPMKESLRQLLNNYVIKIIPMMNPDGVIVGNSRCNLKGYDLNRMWNQPDCQKTPQIYNILRTIMKSQGKIAMFIDLHGHSKKKNVFAYGCHDFRQPFATRQFPYLLSKVNKDDFLFRQCRFTRAQPLKAKSVKQGTARMTLWRKLKIHNIFTIQNSYCSAEGSQYHYDEMSYKAIGASILQAICLYFNSQKQCNKQQNLANENLQKSTILQQLRMNSQNISVGLQKTEESQSQAQERITDIKMKKDKSTRERSQVKQKNELHIKTLKKNTKSKPELSLQSKYQEVQINAQAKYSKHPIVITDKRRLQSMIGLRRFNIQGQHLPSHTQFRRGTLSRPYVSKKHPYQVTRVTNNQSCLKGQTLGIKSQTNVSMRNRITKYGETVDYDTIKPTSLSIVEIGPASLLPSFQGDKIGYRKNLIFHSNQKKIEELKQQRQIKKNQSNIQVNNQLLNNHISTYQICNALKRGTQTKFHNLITKIEKLSMATKKRQ